jgi:hypothetical protein
MPVKNILERLEQVKPTGSDTWRCKCPCDHKSPSQMTVKELPDGRVLIHCFAGHSPSEIMQALDMALGDLFEERLEDRIRPLYMATQEKKKLATIHDKIKSCQLRLDMAQEMRDRNMRLDNKDLATEHDAFVEMRHLQGANNALV